MNAKNYTKLVGSVIKSKRESLGLSQKTLGLLLNPTVTTQFISNVERGITPLPAAHISTMAKALHIEEQEILSLLEKEFALKMNSKVGKDSSYHSETSSLDAKKISSHLALIVDNKDYDFLNKMYSKLKSLDLNHKLEIMTQIAKLVG